MVKEQNFMMWVVYTHPRISTDLSESLSNISITLTVITFLLIHTLLYQDQRGPSNPLMVLNISYQILWILEAEYQMQGTNLIMQPGVLFQNHFTLNIP